MDLETIRDCNAPVLVGPNPPAGESVPRTEITLNTHEEVMGLIAELRRCLRSSERTGGRYSTGVTDTTGRIIINVWVPVQLKGRR